MEWDERAAKLTTSNSSQSQALNNNLDVKVKDNDRNNDFSYLSPPFKVRFDRSMMNDLIKDLRSEIVSDWGAKKYSDNEETGYVDDVDDDENNVEE